MLFWRRRHPIRDEDLSAYVDGELDAASHARVEAHLDVCAACREAVSELGAVRQAMRELPRARAPRSFALREADVRPESPQPVGMLGRATPLLSGVAVVAFLSFWALVGLDVADRPSERITSPSATQFDDTLTETADEEAAALAPSARESADGAEGDDNAVYGEIEMDDELAAREEPGEEPLAVEGAPSPEAVRDAAAEMDAEDGGRTGLRAAEAATAAVALAAAGSLALVWWRRRT